MNGLRCWLSAGFVLLCTLAHAEPGPSVGYLMSDQVSSFSLGLFRIQLQLDRSYASLPGSAAIDYDWDRNRIVITYRSFGASPKANKENCGDEINRMRSIAGIDPESGRAPSGHSFFAEMFSPFGYTKKTEPKHLKEDIDEITELRAILYDPDTKLRVSCRGKLLSTKVLYEEGPAPKPKTSAGSARGAAQKR
jgi:hypothetical protein